MSAFLSPLRVEDLSDDRGPKFVLLFPLVYQSDVLGFTVTVATGFVTDLASIPRGLWNILPPVGAYDRAAVVHDVLYQQPPLGLDRALADAVLKEAMAVCHVSRWRRWLIWSGVRVGGWTVWHRYRSWDEVAP